MPHCLALCTYAVRSGYAYPSALLWVDLLINKVGPCQKKLPARQSFAEPWDEVPVEEFLGDEEGDDEDDIDEEDEEW